MAYPIIHIAIFALLSALVLHKVVQYIQVERFKKANGCEPIRKIPQRDRILGLEFLKTQIRALKAKRNLETVRQRYLDHGKTFSLSLLGQTYINTIEPENIKAVLATKFNNFGVGNRLSAWGQMLGAGIFTTDGPQWEHSRALIRPNFTKDQLADLPALERHIKVFLSQIPRDGSTIDLQPLFFKLSLDYSTEFLLGESVQSLTSLEGSELSRFGQAWEYGSSQLGKRSRLGNLVRLIPDKKFKESCQVIHEFVDKIVVKALARYPSQDSEKTIECDGKSDDDERYVFLHELVKETRDPNALRWELLNILLAGRDATSSFLSNTFHVLARRPDVWAKLKAEVDTLKGHPPNYETLKNMTYLKHVLNESLRLYPPAPSNYRTCHTPTILPHGGGPSGTAPIYVPRGTIIAYHTYTLHRLPEFYGPDAEVFRPERWNAEEGLRPGWAFLPFNGGPRICVGMQFALVVAGYTITRLVGELGELELRGEREWMELLSLTCASGTGVNVTVKG